MKIAHQQLEQQLTKNLASIYLLSSDELLLVEEARDAICKVAREHDYTEKISITADSSADWSNALYTEAQSISLFASKKIIELNMHHIKFTANNTKPLQEYVKAPTQDTLLIIRTNKVDGKTEKSAWFQALEKNSVYLPIWPIASNQLPQWILQRAKKTGLNLTKNTVDFIAEQAEGNLLAAAQEIEKMYLLYGFEQQKQQNTSNEFVSNNTRFDVFDLVESTLSGNKSRSLRILQSLAEEDTEPTLILWALTREFRTMADIMLQLNQGAQLSALFNKYNIFEKRQASVKHFLKQQNQQSCWGLLTQAAAIDRVIKGAEIGNVWDEFEKLVTY